MKQKSALLLAVLGWVTVIVQFCLMMQNRTESGLETTIRFFSFFTILTNTILAFSFSVQAFKRDTIKILTPVTIYITIVGLVYQILLRHTWNPTGVQMLVDESLHTIIPALAIIYWFVYEDNGVGYQQIPKWMIFPAVYLVYVLIRGHYSGFYPYPFVNVTKLGLDKVLLNAGMLLIGFIVIAAVFVWVRKLRSRQVFQKPFG